MPTTSTPNLSVKSVTISSSNKITFQLTSPYAADLYLALVTVVEDPTLTGTNITGVIHPGSSGIRGGYATIYVSPQVYNQFVTFVTSFTGLTLELCYDSYTFTPTEISLGTTQAQIALALNAILADVGAGGILASGITMLSKGVDALLKKSGHPGLSDAPTLES